MIISVCLGVATRTTSILNLLFSQNGEGFVGKVLGVSDQFPVFANIVGGQVMNFERLLAQASADDVFVHRLGFGAKEELGRRG